MLSPVRTGNCLAAEAVQGAALALEGVDDIHGGDGLALGVLGVGDGVTDDVLQEHLENTAGLLVDETADALHATTASQATDGRLSDPLDVIAQNFAMPLGTALSESLASLAASSHLESDLVSTISLAEGTGLRSQRRGRFRVR